MLKETAKELNKKIEKLGTDVLSDAGGIKHMDAETFQKVKNLFEALDLAMTLNQELCATIDDMKKKIDILVDKID